MKLSAGVAAYAGDEGEPRKTIAAHRKGESANSSSAPRKANFDSVVLSARPKSGPSAQFRTAARIFNPVWRWRDHDRLAANDNNRCSECAVPFRRRMPTGPVLPKTALRRTYFRIAGEFA